MRELQHTQREMQDLSLRSKYIDTYSSMYLSACSIFLNEGYLKLSQGQL
mgnify:CR=1 FL=1